MYGVVREHIIVCWEEYNDDCTRDEYNCNLGCSTERTSPRAWEQHSLIVNDQIKLVIPRLPGGRVHERKQGVLTNLYQPA
jgi:hypothetical protein